MIRCTQQILLDDFGKCHFTGQQIEELLECSLGTQLIMISKQLMIIGAKYCKYRFHITSFIQFSYIILSSFLKFLKFKLTKSRKITLNSKLTQSPAWDKSRLQPGKM